MRTFWINHKTGPILHHAVPSKCRCLMDGQQGIVKGCVAITDHHNMVNGGANPAAPATRDLGNYRCTGENAPCFTCSSLMAKWTYAFGAHSCIAVPSFLAPPLQSPPFCQAGSPPGGGGIAPQICAIVSQCKSASAPLAPGIFYAFWAK